MWTTFQAFKREAGFTLIELMIVVAIIGTLAAIAVPNFMAYRNKSRVAAVVGSAEGIRATLANWAADSTDNLYPTVISNWDALVSIANASGGSLKTSMTALSVPSMTYTSDGSDYTLSLIVNVPDSAGLAKIVRVSPSGVEKVLPTP